MLDTYFYPIRSAVCYDKYISLSIVYNEVKN